ncbi:DDE superfamily endonuclease domain-containing protein [Phthorimaea operculella]|nr:DDE superfamily endonuclease domain-containing protein [Phthorimaea operculella]
MDKFDIEFVTEMFLDTDSTTTLNRLVVAIANVVAENSENIDMVTEVLDQEHSNIVKNIIDTPSEVGVGHKRGKRFYEETVLNFTDEDYLDTFNIKKNTVQALINHLQDSVKPGPTVVPFDKKVHVFLWLLTNDISFGEIGAQFGLHKSSVSYIFHEIAALLAEERYHFITWPSMEEQHLTRIKVNSRFKFPNCVGFLDVSQFKVALKRSKKSLPETMLLQAVCDENLRFIDIHIGDVGATKKSKLFRESLLASELKNFVDLDNHILGDSEYKLKKNLITPYSSEEVLTDEEMKFNQIHWRARSYISHAFELLKERFRKLNYLDCSKPDAVKTLICAACVLHNFVLIHEGNRCVKEEPITCDDTVTIDPNIVKTAEEKRQFLCNYINYIDTT